MNRVVIGFGLLIITCSSYVRLHALKATEHHRVSVVEPSDICTSSNSKQYFVVGNRGELSLIDSAGKSIQKINNVGADYEGICKVGNLLYVVDETYRRVDVYDASNLKRLYSVTLNDHGGLNQSFEGITHDPIKNTFYVITEKPVVLHEYNSEWLETRVLSDLGISEASSITINNGFLWVLSDEKMEVYKLDLNTFKILAHRKINVLNPEGICFDKAGDMFIMSDDRQTQYTFKSFANEN